jgi:hypothetical protein
LAERRRTRTPANGSAPSREDIWQAATLLIGVYGREAAAYADDRRCEHQENGDHTAARTWHLIASEIEHLMGTAPAHALH